MNQESLMLVLLPLSELKMSHERFKKSLQSFDIVDKVKDSRRNFDNEVQRVTPSTNIRSSSDGKMNEYKAETKTSRKAATKSKIPAAYRNSLRFREGKVGIWA